MNNLDMPPVLIISYSRPNGVRSLIESCINNGVKDLYIAIDGPKNGESGFFQNEILNVISSYSQIKALKINVLRRQINLGVGVGVISAIDWFFSHEKYGHILEDDLFVDSGFFDFSRLALTKFADDRSVYMISGTEIMGNSSNSAHWCNYPMIWGWSTWVDRWLEMRRGLLNRKRERFPLYFSPRHNYWAVGANRVLDGKVDTWDTPLAAEFISRKWLCLLPPCNLVSNHGNDASASHTTWESFGLNLPVSRLTSNIDFVSNSTKYQIRSYNRQLEKQVFKIQKRHAMLPIYSLIADRENFKLTQPPLNERLKLV